MKTKKLTVPFVEADCSFKCQGREFTADGALVTEGFLVAYPGEGNRLNDWHGNGIGTYRVISSRPAIFFGRRSWQGDRYFYMSATVNGKEYSLRGFGKGMVAMGKAVR